MNQAALLNSFEQEVVKQKNGPHLDKQRHHSFPIRSFVWRFVELQVQVELTDSSLWYHLITVHQRLGVSPGKITRINSWTSILLLNTKGAASEASSNWYILILPVVKPQLTVTGNQVNPLTHGLLFFFKCKNMHSLENERHKIQQLPLHIQYGNIKVEGLVYLFAALSEADSHGLTREEFPNRRRLAGPQSRLVRCRQRIFLERLSELLNFLQSIPPLTHLQVRINLQLANSLLFSLKDSFTQWSLVILSFFNLK